MGLNKGRKTGAASNPSIITASEETRKIQVSEDIQGKIPVDTDFYRFILIIIR